jgi:5-formyltetrahydrofolate cyclo-ligase
VSSDDSSHADIEIRHRAKQVLRKQMRAVRAALPESARDARSSEIAERVRTLPELVSAHTVLAFASIRNEVRTREIMNTAWADGKRVALPRVDGDALSLYIVEADTVLIEGAFSVPEPDAAAPRLEPSEVDFALVPALAVDPRGFRIGYGGGYYDKLLPLLDRASSCALAYDFQLIPEVPELPFDATVDLIVTDARLIRPE